MYFFLLPTHSPTSVLLCAVKAPLCLWDLCWHVPGSCILCDLCCSMCSPSACGELGETPLPEAQEGSDLIFTFVRPPLHVNRTQLVLVHLVPPRCTDPGIQLRQQMLPELSPCPPAMSSCPFPLSLVLQSPGPLNAVWSQQLPGSCSPASTLLELGEVISIARNSLDHRAGGGSW